ncbi:MAG: hypothetical protein Q8L81_05750 [Bacteroidota bacterium]|nr:hypothetical protein [Bacteroidota bacterium]
MIPSLVKILKRLKFVVYDKPYQLNIFGIRSPETNSNKFDDELHVFFRDTQLNWKHFKYSITTDPGTYWLLNPLQVLGTAILKAGQYINAYRIGLHKGQYKALVQNKAVTVIRDYDRNAVLDFGNGKEDTGMFGVNIHRSSATGSSANVDKWSAGCQVFKNINDFNQFLSLCEMHRARYGNLFTYSLLDLRMIKRTTRRQLAYLGGTLIGLAGILFLAINYKNKQYGKAN